MREFVDKAKIHQAEEDPVEVLEFMYGDHLCRSVRPDETQLALVVAAQAEGYGESSEQLAAILHFFANILDDETNMYFLRRLRNRPDKFGFEDMLEILSGLVEEWTGNPTKPSFVSTPSSEESGPRSMAVAPSLESTPSISAPLVSTT